MTRFPTLACPLALLLASCSNITPTKTVDLCQGDSWSPNCEACRASVPDAHCEQCKGASPAAGCKNASGGSGGGSGGNSGSGGSGGKGGASGSGNSGAGGGGTEAGMAGTGGTSSAMDAGKDAGPCNGACTGTKPVCVSGACEECGGNGDCTADPGKTRCEPATHSCVQCLAKGDCSGDTPQCDTSAGGMHTCVQCLQSTDCTDAAKPVCADGACVACVENADCKDPTNPECKDHACGACTGNAACADRTGTPHCDTTSSSASKGQCVGCIVNADCSDLASPQCSSTRQCVACTSDTACTGRAGTEVCETDAAAPMHGQCVQCTPAKRSACGANACKRSDGTCTSTVYQQLLPCSPCVTDGECVMGAKCVVHDFDSTHHLGPYCFYDRVQKTACADTTHTELRPYSNAVATTSIDGASSTYCLPVTTCQAYLDANTMLSCGTNDSVCGLANLSDGHCVQDSGSAANGKCSYICSQPSDCPGTGFANCDFPPNQIPQVFKVCQ